jgi:hypothetical protein
VNPVGHAGPLGEPLLAEERLPLLDGGAVDAVGQFAVEAAQELAAVFDGVGRLAGRPQVREVRFDEITHVGILCDM